MRKYKLTNKKKEVYGHTLYRIKAEESFCDVKKGDYGGWIETQKNLSQNGNAWVYGETKVYGNAWVYENAKVYGDAKVYENAKVYGNAWVYGETKVYGDARVCGDAKVCENAKVYENAIVHGEAWVSENTKVYGKAQVCGNAWVCGESKVYENAQVYGESLVCENAKVYGDASVYGESKVYGKAQVCGNAWVCGESKVYENAQVYENAWVYGYASVYGDAKVYGKAQIFGNAKVCGNASVFESHVLTNGYIKKSLKDIKYSIMAQIGIIPQKKMILWKRVNKIKKGKYSSVFDSKFIYEDKKIVKVKNVDKSNKSCSTGLHFSGPLYWGSGDTLIACEIELKDVITCQEGKIRCSKCKVIGEVK